jgi:hypothetical protein
MSFKEKSGWFSWPVLVLLVLVVLPSIGQSQSTTVRTNRIRQAVIVRRQRPLAAGDTTSPSLNTTTSASAEVDKEDEETDESEDRQLAKTQTNGKNEVPPFQLEEDCIESLKV